MCLTYVRACLGVIGALLGSTRTVPTLQHWPCGEIGLAEDMATSDLRQRRWRDTSSTMIPEVNKAARYERPMTRWPLLNLVISATRDEGWQQEGRWWKQATKEEGFARGSS